MTSSSTIISDIDDFVAMENTNRGQTLASGAILPKMYDALTGTVPAGDDAVTGVAGIAAGAPAITLPSTGIGNAVVIDGDISTTASTSGADSYSVLVSTGGVVTLTDNNTGNSETITNADYLLFDGAATTSSGAFQHMVLIESGVNAEMAAMYNAAYGRVPDLAGLEFYIAQYGTPILPNLTTMANYFLKSPEFQTHWPSLQTIPDNGGPNDVAYIDALYGQILGRTPSASEIQFYVEALQGKLTDSNGNTEPASTRADLLVYFSISPENLSKIAASNGGWLIDTSTGATNLGALSTNAATALLTSEVASGTVNASDFANLSDSSRIGADVPGGTTGVGIIGSAVGAGTAAQQADAEIASTAPNIIINLSAKYISVGLYGLNDTVNSPVSGGGIIGLASNYPGASTVNNAGTVNLSGNVNWIELGNYYFPSTVPAVINGWDSTDIIAQASAPSYGATAASLLAQPDGIIMVGSASNPVNGAAISSSLSSAVAINVGSIANDTVAAIVSAANIAFHENGNYLTRYPIEVTFFFGQDPQGNTMVWYWRGDTNHAGTVLASDITGGIELVGVQASSLTSANFHN